MPEGTNLSRLISEPQLRIKGISLNQPKGTSLKLLGDASLSPQS
jgi:hypothetical protein